MTTGQLYGVSVFPLNLLFLLASFMVAEPKSPRPAIYSLRLALLGSSVSWGMYLVFSDPVMIAFSLVFDAIYFWGFIDFSFRRAGQEGSGYTVAGFLAQCAAYFWLQLSGRGEFVPHIGAIFSCIAAAFIWRNIMIVKARRGKADFCLTLTFLVLAMALSARSMMMLLNPAFFHQQEFALYVSWPVAYTAAAIFSFGGYMSDAEQRLRDLSLRDPLTGLLNRRGFEEYFRHLKAQAIRRSFPLTMLSLDIDRFKSINDTHGHDAGDAVLRNIAGIIETTVREGDLVARFGGEEFVVLLPFSKLEEGEICAERIRQAVAARVVETPGAVIHMTVSIGAACVKAGESLDVLFRVADAALYRAKANGRNRVEVMDANLYASILNSSPSPSHAPS